MPGHEAAMSIYAFPYDDCDMSNNMAIKDIKKNVVQELVLHACDTLYIYRYVVVVFILQKVSAKYCFIFLFYHANHGERKQYTTIL